MYKKKEKKLTLQERESKKKKQNKERIFGGVGMKIEKRQKWYRLGMFP